MQRMVVLYEVFYDAYLHFDPFREDTWVQ